MTHTPIAFEEMRSKLRTVDQAREILATTEPLSTIDFSVGDGVQFVLNPGWNHGVEAKAGTELVDGFIVVGRGLAVTEHQLTKDAVLEATSLCGIPKTYTVRCPAELIEPQLNWWFREGLLTRSTMPRDFQLLIANQRGAAITRAAIKPFSNLRLLDEALAGIEAKYGRGEVLVDHKLTHSLRRTHLRLIVPDHTRAIQGSGTSDDAWSVGVQIRNSLTGEDKTSIDGYLFRWWCTNGAIDTHSTSGVWSRRGGSSEADVYEWARAAVDDVLGGLEGSLDAVQAMVDIPIQGQATEVLRDIFEFYRVPLAQRTKIIENMVEQPSLTMYSVMAAVTQVANDSELEPAHVENLLRLGGDLPHAASSRCTSCRRLLPH